MLKRNANACCVCKQRGIGLNIHHIDGDASNTVDPNLAVLCVKDHDAHHRPGAYTSNHIELGADRILEFKKSWEAFVEEAAKPSPKILAVLNLYGTHSQIHSMRLILQWQNQKIEFERVYHLVASGPPEQWIDGALSELEWLGKGIKLITLSEPLDIDYCPTCSSSLSNTIDENMAKKLTEESWESDSQCSIYVNPTFPSIAVLISLKGETIYQGHLHRCGKHLHYTCSNYDEHVLIRKKPSVRTQATRMIARVLLEWEPSKIFIGTGDPDAPSLIDDLDLPLCWEGNQNKEIDESEGARA